MELELSLPVIVDGINVLNFDEGGNVFNDLCNFSESVLVDHIEHLFIKQLYKVGISFIFHLWVSLINPI